MMKDYEQIYVKLGINVAPLDENYNPENYGRELMRGTLVSDGVMYSSTTNYDNKISKGIFNSGNNAYA